MRWSSRFAVFVSTLSILSNIPGTLYAKQKANTVKSTKPASLKKIEDAKGETLTIKIKPGLVTIVPASQGYVTHLKIEGSRNFEARSSGGINIFKIGENNLVITFTSVDHPADLLIHDKDTDEIYLLALVPQPIPPRSYELILSSETVTTRNSHDKKSSSGKNERETLEIKVRKPVFGIARPEGFEEDYESTLLDIIAQIALGKKPQGFSEQTPWLKLEYRYEFRPIKGLVLHSVKRYKNADMEAIVFLARNESNETLKIREPYFWQKGVLAVTFMKNFFEHEDQKELSLAPGESLPVIIVRKLFRKDSP